MRRGRIRGGLVGLGCLVVGVIGCQSVPDPPATVTAVAPARGLGSLWEEENGRAYLYEDLRAKRVGDILTIQIVENHKGSKSANTKAERDSTVKNSLGGTTVGIPGLNMATAMNGRFVPGLAVNASAQSKFGGKGATDRADTLTGTVSAVVTDVLPNGNLRIRGEREVTVNSETQTMSIAGLVRPVDIDTKNQVLSTAIAEAKIKYTGLGVVDDVQRPGWLTRVLDWIYPF